MGDLAGALSFLTVFGGARPLGRRSDLAFPVVGLAIGAVLGFGWWVAYKYLEPLVAACLVVAADAVITGGLHLDGLADAGDGLLSTASMTRERRLEVMKDPRSGAAGVLALALVLAVRIGALASVHLGLWESVFVIAAIWCASRASMALGPRVLDYARDTGTGGAMAGAKASRGVFDLIWVAVWGMAVPLGLLFAALGNAAEAVAVVLVGCGACLVALGFSKRRIGGYTGDVLGACGLLVETAALIVVAGRW